MEVEKRSLTELLLSRQWLITMSNSTKSCARDAAIKLAEVDEELTARVIYKKKIKCCCCIEKKEILSFEDEDFDDTLEKFKRGALEELEE